MKMLNELKPFIIFIQALLLLACLGMLTSCGLDLQGSVSYRDATTGAKGGLDFRKGKKPSPWLRAPVKDENGNSVLIDLRSGK